MLNTLKSLFARDGEPATPEGPKRHYVASAALLVEAAHLDETYGEQERTVIRRVLTERFGLATDEADALLEAGESAQEASVQLYGFTRDIKENLAPEDRVDVIEMLWEVAYADGVLHDYEAHLVRRVAGLIYVSDRDRGDARKRVLDRLGLEEG